MSEQLALIEMPPMDPAWERTEAYYSRPEYVWPLLAYLEECGLAQEGVIVEPCVGGGALVDGMRARWRNIDRDVLTGDIRNVYCDWVGDWTADPDTWKWNRHVRRYLRDAVLVASNPAFSIARQIVEASWVKCPNATTAVLVPASFWCSQGRTAWLRAHNPDILNIGRCDFFRPDGSSAGPGDSVDYFWCIWGPDRQGPRGGHHELRPWKEAL
jgi:hypothetical protein